MISCTPSQIKIASTRVSKLPEPPAYIQKCLWEKFSVDTKRVKTTQDAVRIMAKLNFDRVKKTRCGRDLFEWYGDVRRTYSR